MRFRHHQKDLHVIACEEKVCFRLRNRSVDENRRKDDKTKEAQTASKLLLAPETGLEPVTRRLTAGCSTIELLWMPKQRGVYVPYPVASNGICPRGCSSLLWQQGQ